MFHRHFKPSLKKSFFLFGAHGTGKSTLLKTLLSHEKAHTIDLLTEENRFATDPKRLFHEVQNLTHPWVVIDEIQKIPELLDIVHALIEKKRWKFALTGSSARKLKRGGGNFLAGRALMYSLFPLTHRECEEKFNLPFILENGSLPEVFSFETTEDRRQFLRSYAQTYLKEEIKSEQIVRKLQPFRKFLEVSAQCNGKILNFSKIATDVGADTKTVQEYFHILEDTLLGTLLEPYHGSIRKRQRRNPKFYFFDTGIVRALSQTLTVPLLPQTSAFGHAFEHFVINEIFRLNNYQNKDYSFSYFMTKDHAEIDLIIERPGLPLALVEIKSTTSIREDHLRSLQKLRKDFKKCEAFCLSLDTHSQKIESVRALHWKEGIQALGL